MSLENIKNLLFTEISTLARFAVIGILATLVHLGVAAAFLSVYGNAIFIANLVAFLVAINVSFYGHRYITFQAKGSFRRFFLVAVLGFGINNLFLSGFIFSGLIEGMAAITVSVLCVPFVVFVLSRFWVFDRP